MYASRDDRQALFRVQPTVVPNLLPHVVNMLRAWLDKAPISLSNQSIYQPISPINGFSFAHPHLTSALSPLSCCLGIAP